MCFAVFNYKALSLKIKHNKYFSQLVIITQVLRFICSDHYN
jgi:hypothetical protein